MSGENITFFNTIIYGHPLCNGWPNHIEGAIYHLGNTILCLGYMGGSGAYGALYIFSFLAPAFLCLALWGWLSVCGLDVFIWNLVLMAESLAQVGHLLFQLLHNGMANEELSALYSAVYLPQGVPIPVFKEIMGACENKVSLTAEMDCRYVSWSRRRLYLLLSKDRYIAHLFSVMLGSDIADKLYSLNDKLFAKSGVRLDIRLPSLYHVLGPSLPSSSRDSGSSPPRASKGDATLAMPALADACPYADAPDAQQGQEKEALPEPQPSQQRVWPSDTENPLGEDSTSLVLDDFVDVIGSLVDYGSERDYLK